MFTKRLVRESDQNKDGSADHEGEDTKIEQQGAGRRHFSDMRYFRILEERGEERIAEEPRSCACCSCKQQAQPDPAQGQNAQAIFYHTRA